MVRILYNIVAIEVSAATYWRGHFLFDGQLFLWTYSRIGAPMVRQDNSFPPSICKENSAKKHACMRSELAPAIGALLLPMMHVAHITSVLWRTLCSKLQASSFEPQVFTHASPCRFYLLLLLAGVRSTNIANLRPSECMSGFSRSAPT